MNIHIPVLMHIHISVSRKDTEINGLNSKLEDEQNLVAQLQKKIKELNVSTPHVIYTALSISRGIFFQPTQKRCPKARP